MLGLENGTSQKHVPSGACRNISCAREREAHCAGAGVCSLLFAALVPILSLPHTPCLSHLAATASSETESNVERDKNTVKKIVFLSQMFAYLQ